MKISDEAVQAALGGYRGHATHDSALRSALTASLPHLQLGNEVKKLEWSEHSDPNENCSYDHTFSETSIGKYQIEWKSWKDYDAYVVYLSDGFISSEYDLTSAKAAAQADFERRVRECLITKPVDVAAVRRQALEAVEELANVKMDLSLEDWSRISSVIIRALSAEPVQGEQWQQQARDLDRAALAQGGGE